MNEHRQLIDFPASRHQARRDAEALRRLAAITDALLPGEASSFRDNIVQYLRGAADALDGVADVTYHE